MTIPILDELPKPRSAWLLMGDKESRHSRAKLRYWFEQLKVNWCETWTSSPLVEPGDLLFIYYMAPQKAILEVTRALSRPVPDRRATIASVQPVARFQWMVSIAPPVEIKPISYTDLSVAMDERPVLKGRSGKYLPNSVANKLIKLIKQVDVSFSPDPELTSYIVQPVVGRDDLPKRVLMPLSRWSGIPSARLRLEKEVERYIVDPLLKLCEVEPRFQISRQCPVARGVADYVITFAGSPTCVLEVKQRIECADEDTPWTDSGHHQQLQKYANTLRCQGALIDCDQIFLFGRTGDFIQRYERRYLSRDELAAIARHLKGRERKEVAKKPNIQ